MERGVGRIVVYESPVGRRLSGIRRKEEMGGGVGGKGQRENTKAPCGW